MLGGLSKVCTTNWYSTSSVYDRLRFPFEGRELSIFTSIQQMFFSI